MLASRALAERWEEADSHAGSGAAPLKPIVAALLREVGRSLTLAENDPSLPFLRTRGVLRLPSAPAGTALVQALNALGAVVREYLRHLPGITREIDEQIRASLRHAARAILVLHRRLRADELTPAEARLFGGVVLLAYPSAPPATTSATTLEPP